MMRIVRCLLPWALLPILAAATSAPLAGRHAHWVLRTSDLEASVTFYKEVFGMRVLRHEENPGACPITCNGRFETAWSKTMVGYDTEDRAYALELTYNYGVGFYEPGEGLISIALCVPQTLDAAGAAAEKLGYQVSTDMARGAEVILGPDRYAYELLECPGEGALEPFRHVRLRVRDAAASVAFYRDFLGMVEHGGALGYRAAGGKGAVGVFAGAPLILGGTTDGAAVRVEQWEGRHAVTLPAESLRQVYAKFEADAPQLIVHELRELDEQLGILLIAIVKDLDGLELCLVSAEVFDPAVRHAADFKEPNWAERRTLEREGHAAAAEDASEAPWKVEF